MTRIALLNIGTELLSGRTVNTNAAEIGKLLRTIGMRPDFSVAVPDTETAITNGLEQCMQQHEVVIVTGGLGPTRDDITKKVLLQFFGGEMQLHNATMTRLEEWYRQRNRPMNDSMRQQARVPSSCSVLENLWGTAPGMHFEKEGIHVISLPGVPKEMTALMREKVIPLLAGLFGSRPSPLRMLKTFGIPESEINERVNAIESRIPEGVSIAYLPTYGEVKIEFTLKVDEQDERKLATAQQLFQDTLGEFVFTTEDAKPEEVLGLRLRQKGMRIALAESCTGGTLASLLTSVSGSSDYFNGSLVTYSTLAKTQVLGVNAELIRHSGVVSEATATAMAEQARKTFGSDIGVGITGVAEAKKGDPDYETPVIWVAVTDGKHTTVRKAVYLLDRTSNIRMACNLAMFLAMRMLKD